jgi:hypothetical protein
MENLFNTTVIVVALTASAFSFAFFWAILSERAPVIERKLFDKSKLKYSDGDNT